ncbi:hypothetical protein H310_14165 [Aphanomyces invadans]|uniref:Uncharacterized protein n=1 Tax=Aphanomyces invadans TaxID=157072 RepID=A0A024TAW3_9STRA|nr:hypothetical protein H310_14165 [Aphanomyces invadans]ETV91154.1 hypothetical protein H310_14165 [Aphanomyces invadans]|eukprot:XP_008880185.1 hypothetical protein H310_14165 [Aphanomyces invadans]
MAKKTTTGKNEAICFTTVKTPEPVDVHFRNPYAQPIGPTPGAAPAPAPTPAPAQSTPDVEDFGMEADYEVVYFFHAPVLPTPPSFCGDTRAEKRLFMRDFEKYRCQIEALHAAGKLWQSWSMTAYQQPPPLEADDLVEKIKSKMVCDMTIPEGDSRVDRMVAAASRYAEEIGQSWIFDVEPKLFAEAIISQLQPPGLKAQVRRFTSWLKQYAAGYQEYHDEARELRKLKATKAAAVTPQMIKSESQRIGAAAAKSTEKEQGTSRSNQDVKCLKCGSSEHKPYGQSSEPLRVTRLAHFKTVQLESRLARLRCVSWYLGFRQDSMLDEALRMKQCDISTMSRCITPLGLISRLGDLSVEADEGTVDDDLCTTPEVKRGPEAAEVERILNVKIVKIAEARERGLSEHHSSTLHGILMTYVDV